MLCNAKSPCSAPASATQPSLPILHPENNPQSAKTKTHTQYISNLKQNIPHAPLRSMLCNAESPCSAPASATQPSLPISQSENNPTISKDSKKQHQTCQTTIQNIPHAQLRSMLCNAECPCSAPASATQPSLPILHPEHNPQSAKTKTHTTHPTPHNKISLTHIQD